MTFDVYRPRQGNSTPPDALILAVRKRGDRLICTFRFGERVAESWGIAEGDRIDVGRGTDGDAGLVRFTKEGVLKVCRSGKYTSALEVRLPAEFLRIDRKYKTQLCKSPKVAPDGQLFARLPAFAIKNSDVDEA